MNSVITSLIDELQGEHQNDDVIRCAGRLHAAIKAEIGAMRKLIVFYEEEIQYYEGEIWEKNQEICDLKRDLRNLLKEVGK